MGRTGHKYTQLKDYSVDIDDEDEDLITRRSPSYVSCCSSCLECFDFLVSLVLQLLLYAYRRVANRYPLFLENNGQELVREEVRRLQNENADLRESVVNLKNEISIKTGVIKGLEMDNALGKDKILQREKQIQTLYQEKKVLDEDKQEALRRLSEHMSVQLRDNNPNIVDLSDQCRPTKLAEMFAELYDNEWTNAFSLLEESVGEEHAIVVLLDIFMDAYRYCENTVAVPWTILNTWFLDMNLPGAKQVSKWLKDSRKTNIRNKISEVKKGFTDELIGRCDDSKIIHVLTQPEITEYMTKCIELCLLMVATDPPVVVHVSENRSGANLIQTGEGTEKSAIFNKDLFKEYTTRGHYLDFIVWPALFLHQDGPMLSKGIAQGSVDVCKRQSWTWKK